MKLLTVISSHFLVSGVTQSQKQHRTTVNLILAVSSIEDFSPAQLLLTSLLN